MNPSRLGLAFVVCGALLAAPRPAAAQTTRVSVSSSGEQGNRESMSSCLTPDGVIVGFWSWASNLVPGDTNGVADAFVYDRSTGITERVSLDSNGAEADDYSGCDAISADGRYVVFSSFARNLVTFDPNAGVPAVYVRDRSTGTTERVSVATSGVPSNSMSMNASISPDGRYVVFQSLGSNLVDGDTNGAFDVFLHDRVLGTTERVSVDSSGTEGDDDSYVVGVAVSADGRFVAFQSYADNLVPGDTNQKSDVFLRDRSTGTTERVSVDSSGNQANDQSGSGCISADGMLVAFASDATNLAPDQTDRTSNVYVRDRSTGKTEWISMNYAGDGGEGGEPTISADGRFVAFDSFVNDLVRGDKNGKKDAFLRDRLLGVTELVSVDSSGAQANDLSTPVAISADGRVVAFSSLATNLVGGDTNGFYDAFIRDRAANGASWANYGTGFPGTHGVAAFKSRVDPVVGATITLDLGNSFGEYTVGVLFIGFEPAVIHSNWGGDLLVVPQITQLVGLTPWGTSLFGDIPDDESLCGCHLELQSVEADPGAARGVSFTRGLDLVLGR